MGSTEWLRRSVLYVPGDSVRMLQRSTRVGCDLLLLNLEDGVSSARKDEARANVMGALETLDFAGAEVVVRVNPIASAVGRLDLAQTVARRPHGICLPKVESAAQVREAEAAILELETASSSAAPLVGLHAMIESAEGVLRAREIAGASPRMRSLIFGSADYVADLDCRPGEDRFELSFALQAIVTAARAASIDAIDAPCFDIHNSDLLRRESAQARRFGFTGKSALHPAQVAVIHEVFTVSADEVRWALRVIAELDSAEERGRALSTIDGTLVDNPHRVAAERILRRRPSS